MFNQEIQALAHIRKLQIYRDELIEVNKNMYFSLHWNPRWGSYQNNLNETQIKVSKEVSSEEDGRSGQNVAVVLPHYLHNNFIHFFLRPML